MSNLNVCPLTQKYITDRFIIVEYFKQLFERIHCRTQNDGKLRNLSFDIKLKVGTFEGKISQIEVRKIAFTVS
jgi:hypothetical protein